MQQGEEYREVACRRHPKLDIRHAFKRALYLAHAFDEAHQPQCGQKGDVRREQVAQQDTRSRPAQQCLVRETELHAEQQREIDSHSRQVRIKTHLEVFPHQDKARRRTGR